MFIQSTPPLSSNRFFPEFSSSIPGTDLERASNPRSRCLKSHVNVIISLQHAQQRLRAIESHLQHQHLPTTEVYILTIVVQHASLPRPLSWRSVRQLRAARRPTVPLRIHSMLTPVTRLPAMLREAAGRTLLACICTIHGKLKTCAQTRRGPPPTAPPPCILYRGKRLCSTPPNRWSESMRKFTGSRRSGTLERHLHVTAPEKGSSAIPDADFGYQVRTTSTLGTDE